jgi:hypothetical protein
MEAAAILVAPTLRTKQAKSANCTPTQAHS